MEITKKGVAGRVKIKIIGSKVTSSMKTAKEYGFLFEDFDPKPSVRKTRTGKWVQVRNDMEMYFPFF